MEDAVPGDEDPLDKLGDELMDEDLQINQGNQAASSSSNAKRTATVDPATATGQSATESPAKKTRTGDEMQLSSLKSVAGQCPFETEVVKHLNHLSVDVAEVFSPPRVTSQAEKMGLRAGEAMDVSTGWDFNLPADRKRAWDYLEKFKPKLLIGSPMCTMFSKLQNLSKWTSMK